MVFLQQIIELLSRPPGSVIYHLVTLFALQVVLALAFSRWQRDANDESARRMTFAAGGILIARLVMLFVGLMVEGDPAQARIVLPPLEQAIDMATVLLLVWGLASFAMDRPRLADGLLLVSLVVVAVMFLFFFQDWQNRVTVTGAATAYIGTIQAYVWGVLQMAILAVGLMWLVMDRTSRFTLRPIIVAVVLLAHVANFFNYPEIIPTGTEIVYWLRLGYLVAFPLWAVQAYRDNIRGLLTPAEAERLQSAQLARNLRLSTSVISARIPEVRLEQALDMVTGLIPTRLAAIGLIDEKNPLPANPEGVARLEAAITDVAQPPAAQPAPPLPDLARTFAEVAARRDQLNTFEVFHFAGHAISGQQWRDAIEPIALAQGWIKPDANLHYKRLPWPLMRLGAMFVPTWAALLEMRYLWDSAHALDNRKLLAFLGAEPHTALPIALTQTLRDLGFTKGD